MEVNVRLTKPWGFNQAGRIVSVTPGVADTITRIGKGTVIETVQGVQEKPARKTKAPK